MLIGDTVYLHPSQSPPGAGHPGTVVYIHPERRYYVVEFRFPYIPGVVRAFRESFFFPERAGEADYNGGQSDAERKRQSRIRQGRHNKKQRSESYD